MKRACFVTGTDTEVGKTFVSCALLQHLAACGLSTVGMKPVAAGASIANGVRVNEDVACLLAASSVAADPALVNPFCFETPIAPHIAAAEEGVRISAAPIVDAFDKLLALADVVVVEGVGGFRVPLSDDYDTADLASDLGLPIILVVGMKLGCINHALLSVEAIRARGLHLAGWIANQIDPQMLRFGQNVAALEKLIPAPLLGSVAHRNDHRTSGALLACHDLLDHLPALRP